MQTHNCAFSGTELSPKAKLGSFKLNRTWQYPLDMHLSFSSVLFCIFHRMLLDSVVRVLCLFLVFLISETFSKLSFVVSTLFKNSPSGQKIKKKKKKFHIVSLFFIKHTFVRCYI